MPEIGLVRFARLALEVSRAAKNYLWLLRTIPAKRRSSCKASGVRLQMLENFRIGQYGKRSLIESVFSAVKRKLSSTYTQKNHLGYVLDRRSKGFRLLCGMQTGLPVRIVKVERLREGIIVEFDDGTGYVYPTDLVLDMLPYAREIEDLDTDERNVDL